MAFHGEILRPIPPSNCIERLEQNILALVVTIHSWYEQYKLGVVVNGFVNTCISISFLYLHFCSLYTLRKLIKILIVSVVKALAP